MFNKFQENIDRILLKLGYQRILPELDEQETYVPCTLGMCRYNSDQETKHETIEISKIIVPTQEDKEQLIRAFKYLHDLRVIDTDLMAVNTIIHQYKVPDNIVVDRRTSPRKKDLTAYLTQTGT